MPFDAVMQVHADNLKLQTSMVATSEPAKEQVAVKARSLHAQAESLEAQADAQTLQVYAEPSPSCKLRMNCCRQYWDVGCCYCFHLHDSILLLRGAACVFAASW